MPLIEVDGTYVGLPPAEAFGRPIWAYGQLNGGWRILRYLLFGYSTRMIAELEAYGDARLEPQEVYHHARDCQVPISIAQVIAAASTTRTASELIDWYCHWENCVFEAYLQVEKHIIFSPTMFEGYLFRP